MNQRPRVLHVINGLGDGGAESVLHRLCQDDTHFEHVVVALLAEDKYAPLLRAAGVAVHTLDMAPGRVGPASIARLWRLLGESQPDVVQTWMYHSDLLGGLLARLRRCAPICWNIRHADLDPAHSSRASLLSGRLCARLSRVIPDVIVCCGDRAAQRHVSLGYDPARIRVIPNGYDTTQFRPDADARRRLRQQLGVDEAGPLLGMVANFKPDKDHATLLAALAELARRGRGFRCLLAGRDLGAGDAGIMALVRHHGLESRVQLLGPQTDVPALMNALDLHLLSSRSEGFPNVLAEAMACATPCVTTDAGDAAQIVGATGWVVPPRSPVALADALEQALDELADAPAWGARQRAARQRILDHYSLGVMRGAYQALWSEMAR